MKETNTDDYSDLLKNIENKFSKRAFEITLRSPYLVSRSTLKVASKIDNKHALKAIESIAQYGQHNSHYLIKYAQRIDNKWAAKAFHDVIKSPSFSHSQAIDLSTRIETEIAYEAVVEVMDDSDSTYRDLYRVLSQNTPSFGTRCMKGIRSLFGRSK